ncbi:oligosaccharide flippase family protein [Acidobacteriota bacterium]
MNENTDPQSLREIFKQKFQFLFKKGFFHIFGSELLSKIIRFGSSVIIVNILSKNLYGSYSYANNILLFFLLLSGLGVQTAILQFCSEKELLREKLPFLKYGLKIGLITNGFISVSILIFTLFFNLPVKGSRDILFYLALIPLLTICYEIIASFLRAHLRNREFSYVKISFTSLYFIGVLVGGSYFKIAGIIFSYYLALTVSVILGMWFLFREVKTEKKVSFPVKKEKLEFVKFALIAALTNSISQILYLLDIFFIGIIIQSEAAVASYKVAVIIPFALNFIPSSIMMFVYPYFAKNIRDTRKLKRYFNELQKYLLILNTGISLFLIVFAPVLLNFLYKGQYPDAVLPFRILSFGFLVAATFRIPAGNVLASVRKVNVNLVTSTLSGILNIALNIILIKKLGSLGAAYATVSVLIFSSILSNVYLRHYFKRNIG